MSIATTAAPDPPTASVLLKAENLHKSFGGVRAVRDISLATRRGAIHAVIGPNGAGKSTLLNLLSGIYRPDAGTITFEGADLTHLSAHQRVGHGIARTFQKIRLFRHLSVLENVVAGFHLRHDIRAWQYLLHGTAFRRDRDRCRDEAMRLLGFMGLAERASVTAGSLSYGEQRMLEIARALATKPRLLLVDEPAAGLNALEVDMLLERMSTLRDGGLTLLIVEHNMDLVMQLADSIMVIDYGQYLFEGTAAEVQAHAGVIDAYLGGATA
jgi:ABC-type branched-subunit amino acid transport system ATPase component